MRVHVQAMIREVSNLFSVIDYLLGARVIDNYREGQMRGNHLLRLVLFI